MAGDVLTVSLFMFCLLHVRLLHSLINSIPIATWSFVKRVEAKEREKIWQPV